MRRPSPAASTMAWVRVVINHLLSNGTGGHGLALGGCGRTSRARALELARPASLPAIARRGGGVAGIRACRRGGTGGRRRRRYARAGRRPGRRRSAGMHRGPGWGNCSGSGRSTGLARGCGDIPAGVFQQRHQIVADGAEAGVLEIQQSAGRDAGAVGQPHQVVHVIVPVHQRRADFYRVGGRLSAMPAPARCVRG